VAFSRIVDGTTATIGHRWLRVSAADPSRNDLGALTCEALVDPVTGHIIRCDEHDPFPASTVSGPRSRESRTAAVPADSPATRSWCS
jgi:hypothetical protein